jgi:hypothetical protein
MPPATASKSSGRYSISSITFLSVSLPMGKAALATARETSAVCSRARFLMRVAASAANSEEESPWHPQSKSAKRHP